MKQKHIITIFALIISGNYSLCMQLSKKDPHKHLKFVLEKNLTTTNGIEYNAASPNFQYETLKHCIKTNNMDYLHLYLEYKFNPNRYHKKLSLLHYAIKHHRPEAIIILSQYNPDLTPRNEQGQTPLDYAVSLQCEDCTHAMANVISKKYNQLAMYNKHCGLTKHILKKGPCEKCRTELMQQLRYYNLSDPCMNQTDLEEVITDLHS